MSREDGFPIADVDVSMLEDAKVRQLVRSIGDEALTARCLIGYTAVVLASWRAGDRVTLDEAAPLWLTDLEDLAGRLRGARLLDDESRIPATAWAGWFGPAWDRREERREAGRLGGYAKARLSRAMAEPKQSHGRALPVCTDPTDLSEQSVPNAREIEGTNGTTTIPSEGLCRIYGAHVHDKETGVRVGPGWIEHGEHPPEWAVIS